tara:strand:- start:1449 stop:2591 length:1143 start_codon:yes stop_codon:yes gene_type:complete
MGGGLMQLVAYGAQDIYLTGNPQITFFKVVYRRHTNFSMEAISQTWNGTSDGADGRCTATISRNGDLVHRMYLEITYGTVANKTHDNPGASLINNVELEIGGQKIDKHSGHWMETWAELTEPNPTGNIATDNNKNGTLFQNMSGMGGVKGDSGFAQHDKLFVPLQFWFCRNPGLALPLIALQYHEVKVILDHTMNASVGNGTNQLWADYIYLDTDERRRFAQVSHEYLIEQVQEQSLGAGGGDLNFNHPVKELVWSAKSGKVDATTSAPAAGGAIQLKLNGHDRFAARDFRYFTRTQVWGHHSGGGGLNSDGTGAGNFDDSIGVYSFALKPEEHQPSGTCNFSRIDNAQLNGIDDATTVFAVNYNVLRIMSGMGGLAYSN